MSEGKPHIAEENQKDSIPADIRKTNELENISKVKEEKDKE
jgi:hypothetical protein